ncbi:hypothetical protein P7K49_021294 [Saguinus oedipus]|uniref:Uncharacterized protein n=1 Tax=Saguinus oedipus TaxID=9490 RepID=A0ABQ9US99_SAGOE|nr:hypothetical protein P7K49_021294 [Saguinus oedipus]
MVAQHRAAHAVQTLNEQDWERAQQASVLANVAQAFESDADVSDGEDDRDTLLSSVDLLSPSGQADAHTLALMLQEQLDAINKEIRTSAHSWRALEGLWTCPAPTAVLKAAPGRLRELSTHLEEADGPASLTWSADERCTAVGWEEMAK